MTQSQKTSKFGLGLVIGSVIGGLTAFFLSPKSGKENREWAMETFDELKAMLAEGELQKKVTEIYGHATAKGEKLYLHAKKELNKKLDEIKDTVEDFDKDKYIKMVKEVAAQLTAEAKDAPELVGKLQTYLIENWNQMLKNLEVKQAKK